MDNFWKDNKNNMYDENEETKLFNVTGNFWVDSLILSVVPWLLIGLESNKRLKFVWWKACLVGLAALLLANFSFGDLLGLGTDYKAKYKETLGKYEKLEDKFNDYENKVSEYQSKVDKLEAEKDDKKVVVKETEKATPKPTEKPTKKPVVKKTYNFGPGRYVVGSDIKAGTYDIVCSSGSGNVIAHDNGFMNSVNLIMSTVADDLYISNYKNAKLNKGATLQLESVSVKLIEK
jgi:hypothetical protein